MKPDVEINAMIERLDDNIREHGWDASVDAAMRALEWATGDDRPSLDSYMQRPDAARRAEWIARGGDPAHWPEHPEPGDLVAELRDARTDRERVVVTRADRHVMATAELVRDWLTPDHPRVVLDFSGQTPTVRLGTAGEGLGVVAYEIDRAALAAATQGKVDRVTLRRVE